MSAYLVRLAWQRTFAALVVNVVGMAMDMALRSGVPGVPLWPSICSMAFSCFLLALLVLSRRRASVPLAASIFLANNVGIVSALWVTTGYFSQGLGSWIPFQANKLGALIVAMLAPEQMWAGFLSIALFIGVALVKVWTLRTVASLAPLLGMEVWTLLVFGVFGAALLAYRARSDRLRDDLVEAYATSQALRLVARRLLAISDLANTPLQIIELNLPLLKGDQLEESTSRLERAIGTLRRWHSLLDREAVHLAGSRETESFDAQSVLHERLDVSKDDSA